MISGIALIIASILMILFPQLLSYIIATCLMIVGINLIIQDRQQRRMMQFMESPEFEVFIRSNR